ncbi:MAG TPA: methyl-accepting chemotaxis protein, partial [Aquabacterium sp.]|nr:methyl-accepting chemotaxis protein [Aquabacterium sp.]
AGDSWTALVKNRRKNGDHYWVRANAVPVVREGQAVGYMSVRTKPTRAEIAHAESLYRDIREGRAKGLAFHKGLLVRTGAWAWTSALQTMPARWRVRLSVGPLALMAILGASLAGVEGAALGGYALGALSLTLLVAWWLERQLAHPLKQLLRQAQSVAAGQPGDMQHLNRVDEIGLILRAINQSGLNLRALVDDVSHQVHGLRNSGSEIAQGNNNLSARTEAAAANLEQTAASMEQMTASVKNNAETAAKATELASTASQSAASGGALVNEVVGTMEAITTSSRKISDIIGVIDAIAFQTNILALNAAVEAARAGEQGRGFAVVASEVRGLAQRSANAAKEIKTLISDSVEKVEQGSKLVNHAGVAMGDIVSQVRRVADLIGDISSSSVEQSSGIDQVNTAVGQLDQMTQQNAALVEQSAAAADSMSMQASRLVEAIEVYGRRTGVALVK